MNLSIMQDKPKIVLDTNIVVSALIAKEGAPAKLFEKLILFEVENYTCKEIILELKDVFSRQEIVERTTKRARNFIIRQYLNHSIQLSKKSQIDVVKHHSDNKFIEIALDAKADYLITGDKHLLELFEFQGVKIMRAKEFIEVIITQKREA